MKPQERRSLSPERSQRRAEKSLLYPLVIAIIAVAAVGVLCGGDPGVDQALSGIGKFFRR